MSNIFSGRHSLSLHIAGATMAASIALLAGSQAALAQAASAAPAAAVAAAQPATPVLTKDQIDAYLAKPGEVLFIDLRRPDELAEIGGLPVYLNIQISELDRFLPYIPRDRSIVTVSNHAGRAGKAAALLLNSGFKVVGAVGVEDYAQQGGALYGKKFVTPAIAGVVPAGTRVEVVREGFNGTEGPVALTDGSIVFTENRADRLVKIAANGTPSTYLEHTGGANALALSGKGDLIAVQTTTPGVAVLQPKAKVLAATFSGKPLNRPNDLALARSGDIYFSDPGAPQGAPGAAPAPAATPAKTALYWLDKRGAVHLVADDIRRPNGVALSPDEKVLYVANTAGEYLIAYDLAANGAPGNRRDFARLAGFRQAPNGPTSGADGIVVDATGRVYVATAAGIEVFSPQGAALGVIALPKQPQNLAFGGADRSKLYAVGRGSVYRISTQTRGVDRPGK